MQWYFWNLQFWIRYYIYNWYRTTYFFPNLTVQLQLPLVWIFCNLGIFKRRLFGMKTWNLKMKTIRSGVDIISRIQCRSVFWNYIIPTFRSIGMILGWLKSTFKWAYMLYSSRAPRRGSDLYMCVWEHSAISFTLQLSATHTNDHLMHTYKTRINRIEKWPFF